MSFTLSGIGPRQRRGTGAPRRVERAARLYKLCQRPTKMRRGGLRRNPLQRGWGAAGEARVRLDCFNLPIVGAIHLMYCHARLDRAPDHVFCSAAAWKRHNQIGLAFVEHPLIAQ